jgi:hypothetical protein
MEIDYERLYEGLGWEPLRQDNHGNDVGHCFDPYGYHKHGDRTGKFIFYREDQKASCFVCGGFTLEKLVEVVRECSEEEADQWLDQYREGYEQSDEGFLKEVHDKLTYKYTKRTRSMPVFNESVVTKFISYENWPDIAEDWAEERGLSSETVERFNIHYGRVRRTPPQGVNDKPYLGDAIIIPHYWKDKLVGWQYRWLNDDRPMWLQKYTNTVDFPRDSTVYNYDGARRSGDPIVLVESVTTVLFLAENGVEAVATFGAKLTEGQLKALRGFQQGVILSRDNDKPGEQWSHRLHAYLEPFIPMWDIPPVVIDGEDDGSDLGSLAPNTTALFAQLDRVHN